MPTFTPSADRTIKTEFRDNNLISVSLIERGNKIEEYTPSDRDNWGIGDLLYHHPVGKELSSGIVGGGFLWQINDIHSEGSSQGDVVVASLKGGEQKNKEAGYLRRGIQQEFITLVEQG